MGVRTGHSKRRWRVRRRLRGASDAGGFVIGGAGAVKAGDWVELKLEAPADIVRVFKEGL